MDSTTTKEESIEALMTQLKDNLETLKKVSIDRFEDGTSSSSNSLNSGSMESLKSVERSNVPECGSDDKLALTNGSGASTYMHTLEGGSEIDQAGRVFRGVVRGIRDHVHGPSSVCSTACNSLSTDSLQILITRLRDGLEIFKIGATNNMEGLKRELTESLNALKRGSTDSLCNLKRELKDCIKTLGVESSDSMETLRKELTSTLKNASSRTLEALKGELADSLKALVSQDEDEDDEESSCRLDDILRSMESGPASTSSVAERVEENVDPYRGGSMDKTGSHEILNALHQELSDSLKAIREASGETTEDAQMEMTDTLRALLAGSGNTDDLKTVPRDTSQPLNESFKDYKLESPNCTKNLDNKAGKTPNIRNLHWRPWRLLKEYPWTPLKLIWGKQKIRQKMCLADQLALLWGLQKGHGGGGHKFK